MGKAVRTARVLAPALTLLACGSVTLGPPFHPTTPPGGTGLIYIFRPVQFKGSAVALPVKVDSSDVGAVFNGSYVPFHVRPGNHVLTIAG